MPGINPPIEITDDGTATLRHPVFGDTYHSLHGAVAESEHVFIAAGLAATCKSRVAILEIGFGSGLNAWLSLRYAAEHCIGIDYHALELYPVTQDTALNLGYTDDSLFVKMHTLPWGISGTVTDGFTLAKYETDLLNNKGAWENLSFDLVYFDAFSPDTQPEMWTKNVFMRIFNTLVPGGLLVTYSAKGVVKQTLRSVGFAVKRLPGAPGKRHMIRACKPLPGNLVL